MTTQYIISYLLIIGIRALIKKKTYYFNLLEQAIYYLLVYVR